MAPLLAFSLLLLVGPPPTAPSNPGTRAVPLLSKEQAATPGKLPGGLSIGPDTSGASASFAAKLAVKREGLLLAIEVQDDRLTPGDRITVSAHFPGAGVTAHGYQYRFGFDGKRAADADTGAPPFAEALVEGVARKTATGFQLDARFPLRALPRMPARGPLSLDLCLTYDDQDEVGVAPQALSNCVGGTMVKGSLRLPDALRKGLRLKPPDSVEGIEARPGGWVGFAALRFPTWAFADRDLTPDGLRALVADAPIDPKALNLPLPETVRLASGNLAYVVVSGKDPYAGDGKCDPEAELRLGLFLAEGRVANKVLEWPAATCALGRALSVSVDDDGSLTIGYSNGSTTHFSWSTDHFERTEYGQR